MSGFLLAEPREHAVDNLHAARGMHPNGGGEQEKTGRGRGPGWQRASRRHGEVRMGGGNGGRAKEGGENRKQGGGEAGGGSSRGRGVLNGGAGGAEGQRGIGLDWKGGVGLGGIGARRGRETGAGLHHVTTWSST